MTEPHRQLRAAADRLLADTGIPDLLSRFGPVTMTGSYAYDLMTWRDLDLCLELEAPESDEVFEIGRLLADVPGVGSMYFRNEFVLETPGNPRAMFWCVDLVGPDGKAWKVDVLISTPDEIARVLEPGKRLMEGLTEESRETILAIKAALTEDPAYRREFKSTDIYEAVLHHGVETVEEFLAWLES